MLGLHEYGFAAVPRDSIVCLPECGNTNKFGASFETPSGRRLVIIMSCIMITLTSHNNAQNYLFSLFFKSMYLTDKTCRVHGHDLFHETEFMGLSS